MNNWDISELEDRHELMYSAFVEYCKKRVSTLPWNDFREGWIAGAQWATEQASKQDTEERISV